LRERSEIIDNYKILITIIASLVIISAFRKKHLFKIMVQGQHAETIYGDPPKRFIDECKKAALFHKPKKGYIYGVKENGVIKIAFSKGFDKNKEQAFRNVWAEYPAIGGRQEGRKA
jgi:hypothetical protein